MRSVDRAAPLSRFFGAALVVFGAWVLTFFIGLAHWKATLSNPRVVTDVEIHSGELRAGYDLSGIAVGALLVIAFRIRCHEVDLVTLLSEMLGIICGAVLAFGMIYYSSSQLDAFLPRPFSGQGWADRSAVAYTAVVLLLLLAGTVLTRRRRI